MRIIGRHVSIQTGQNGVVAACCFHAAVQDLLALAAAPTAPATGSTGGADLLGGGSSGTLTGAAQSPLASAGPSENVAGEQLRAFP